MERSNVAEFYSSGESTDDRIATPLNNRSENTAKLIVNNQEDGVEDHGKYSISGINKTPRLEAMEYKGLNKSGRELNSSNSKVLLDNNSNNESAARDNQQMNQTELRRRSVIFSSVTKSKLQARENEEFDDSGLVDSFNNYSSSDEGEVLLNNSSKNESKAGGSQQANKIEGREKVLATKRKLSLKEYEELDESDVNLNKRGRGKYELRSLPKSSSSGNVDKKDSDEKRASNKSGKGRISQVYDEDDSEDSDVVDEMKLRGKTKSDRAQTEDGSSSSQFVHNYKILKLLNEGSPAQLKTLYRIGSKTAMMINQYRKLNGRIRSIRDMGNMPGWSPKVFELFLSANNITLD